MWNRYYIIVISTAIAHLNIAWMLWCGDEGVDGKLLPTENTIPSAEASDPMSRIHSANTKNCLESSKRVFVHIGPMKTGTTSIQNYFACNSQTLDLYHTHYLGKVNPRDVKQCKQTPIDYDRPAVQYHSKQATAKLRHEILKYTSQNNSVILSDEGFVHMPPSLLDILFANITHVIPVVAYRRYHEWLLSLYHFKYNRKWYERNWNAWEGHQLDDIPMLREFASQHGTTFHPTLELMNNFSTHVERITGAAPCTKILNVHQGEIVQELTSLIVGENQFGSIEKANNFLKQSIRSNVNKGLPFSVDVERLALKLNLERRVNTTAKSRRQVVSMLHTQIKKLYLNSTPPLNCLNLDEENALLWKAKDAERLIVPDFFASEEGEVLLEAQFHKLSAEKAFCNLDLDEMLGEDGWEQFISEELYG